MTKSTYSGIDLVALLTDELPTASAETQTRSIINGSAQPLLEFLRDLISGEDTERLELLVDGNTPLHELVRDRQFALRAIARLGLALVADEDTAEAQMGSAVKWLSAANSTPPTSVGWSSARLPASRHSERMMFLARQPEADLAMAILLDLDGVQHRRVTGPSVHVLFDGGRDGWCGRLRLTFLPGMPPCLLPDPRLMSMFTADQAFRDSMADAWRLAGSGLQGTVLWSVDDADGPIDHIVGTSLGAAFSVLLNELRRTTRPIIRWFLPFRVSPMTAIVGAVDASTGQLIGVSGYDTKLSAAPKDARVIVPHDNQAIAEQLSDGREIAPARTWRDAAQASRRPAARAILRIGLAVFIVAAMIFATVALQERDVAQTERDNAIFNHVVAQANQLRSTDVSLATQLDLVAYRMRPDDPNLYSNLISTENIPLASTWASDNGQVNSMQFSPDRRTLATGYHTGAVRLWDITDPAQPVPLGDPLEGHSDAVLNLAFSPTGDVLATSSSDRTVQLWNVDDPGRPRHIRQFDTGHERTISSLAFNRSGRTLATSSSVDRTVRLWNLADTAQPIAQISASQAGSTLLSVEIAFGPDGHTLAVTEDKTVRLWDTTDPAHPTPLGQPLIGHTGVIQSTTFRPDGLLATGSSDQTVRLWDLADPARPVPLEQSLTGHTGAVDDLAFSPDGYILATGSYDQTIRLWNLVNPLQPVPLSPPLPGDVSLLAFAQDRQTLASASIDGIVRLWDLPYTYLTGHGESVGEVEFSPDSGKLATTTNRTVWLWTLPNIASPTLVNHVDHPNYVSSVAFSPDSRTLATASFDQTVRLWNISDINRPTLVKTLSGHTEAVMEIAFSPDGKMLASIEADGTVRLWILANVDTPTLVTLHTPVQPKIGEFVGFSPDGRLLASATADGIVRLWDISKPERSAIAGTIGHTDVVYSAPFSPNGNLLASATADGVVRFWNIVKPRRPEPIGEPLKGVSTDPVFALTFSPNGHTLASANADGTVRIWNISDHQNLNPTPHVLAGNLGSINSISFSPDGRHLASAGNDHTVRIWNLNPEDAIKRICTSARNVLTPEIWRRHVSNQLPYTPPCRDIP